MNQKPYYRDIWTLAPPNAGYPGAFPRGFVNAIKRRWWGKDRLWLFSGSFKDAGGTTVDINPDVKPDYVANCEELPFDDNSFDFVLADPPYSELEARQLYDLDYCNIPKVMNEMARVCRPGGHVILLHRLIPWYGPWENQHKKQLEIVGVVGVLTMAGYTNMRALSVWRKAHTIEDVLAAAEAKTPAREGEAML